MQAGTRQSKQPAWIISRLFLLAAVLLPAALLAQLTTGVFMGTLRAPDGHLLAGESILITGGTGFHIAIHTNASGQFSLTLPYGRYQVSGATVFIAPFETTRAGLIMDAPGAIRIAQLAPEATAGRRYPEGFSLAGALLSREPASVTEPLDFEGLSDNRLAIVSQRGVSWTETQFKLQGMDATDSYQPGSPVIFPDVQSLDEVVVVRSTPELGLFLAEPPTSWHGALSTEDTGAALSWTNLPSPANRGVVEQADQLRWFTRDRAEIGGPISRWAEIYASGTGQWASQAEPLAAPGADQRSRLLFGNALGRVRAGASDRFEGLYSGSRIDLSDGGMPAALEALTGNRMMPSFVLPGGFPGQSEVDHMDFVQAAWTHLLPAASSAGAIEVRYQYSTAHLDTGTPSLGESRVELLGGIISGPPPLANLAVRTRHQIAAAWEPPVLRAWGIRHQIAAGGGWKTSQPVNRFRAPSDMNLITANGAPAFVVEFNAPADSRELVRSFSGYFADHIVLGNSLALDLGAVADFSRGSVPAQASPAGFFTPERSFAAQPDLIVWNSVSPHAGFAWQMPHSHGLVLRGAYFRHYEPLAGRYLDFGNPNSLGGSSYQWITTDPAAPFQPSQAGPLLLRFGGPYSSISPALARPYSYEFDVGAQFPFARRSSAGLHLFRRDEKNRIAAIDTGVPYSAFTPVSVLDPGPDGISGTFDDRRLTVYAQNPATLGQDRYLLTNPPGLGMLNVGVLAEAGTAWRELTLHASFVAEKSYGPTNPGDAFYENDPGVVGSLFMDPNTAIDAAGRIFVDRAYVGKTQAGYRLPSAWGGIEVTTVANYLDGLPFARQLLVTGLPQGPFLVAATVRGSLENGNRAQYAINWNLRVSRRFTLPLGGLTLSADVLNVTNAGQRLQENDLSGTSFNLRLPVAIQPPRLVRIGLRYEF